MKSIKQIALTILLTIGAFSAITYTACNKDACSGVTCQNGGTCASGTCTCSTGYEGDRCQTISRDKFDKSWSASETSSGTGGTASLAYTATIAANTNSTDVTKVVIGGIANGLFTSATTANVTATSITIPSQQPDNDGYVIAGSGTYANGQITWNYTVTNPNNAVLTFTGIWQ